MAEDNSYWVDIAYPQITNRKLKIKKDDNITTRSFDILLFSSTH